MIKNELCEYYLNNEDSYDPEETKNVLAILQGYDDSLTGLSRVDKTLLLRLIDEHELYEKLDEMFPDKSNDENIFN